MKPNIYKNILFAFLFLYSLNGFTQNKKIDSLKNVLNTQKDDSNKVNTLNNLSRLFNQNKINDKAGVYGQAAKALAEKIKFNKGLGDAFVNLGYITTDTSEAFLFFNLAIKIYKEIGRMQDVSNAYHGMGSVSFLKSDYLNAIIHFTKTLEINETIGDKSKIAESNFFIAQSYFGMDNDAEALDRLYRALKLAESIGNKKNIAKYLLTIAGIYSNNKKYAEALKTLEDCLKIYKELNLKWGIANCLSIMAAIYLTEKKYEEVLKMDSAAYQIYKELDDKTGIADHYWTLGELAEMEGQQALSEGNIQLSETKLSEAVNNMLSSVKLMDESGNTGGLSDGYAVLSRLSLKLNKRNDARQYAEKSLSLSKKVGWNDNFKNSYEVLARVDSAEGNFKNAFENYKMYVLYRDSLSTTEEEKKSLHVKMQYDFDKKEAIAKAEQEKKDAEVKRTKRIQYLAIASLAILVLAILIIALIQLRNNKHKQKANILLQQQKEKVESTLTELKATQSQLIQSEKMASLGELTAGIAHEIQNPLNFVNNFSEVNNELIEEVKSQKSKLKSEELDELLTDIFQNNEKINHHGKRADAIVKGMLQHSRSSSGTKELTDINALADEYLRLAYHGLRAKDPRDSANNSFNVTIKTDFDKSIGNINIIPQDIGRVLLNLYNNAFYAVSLPSPEKIGTGAGGFSDSDLNNNPTVWLSTKKVGHNVLISVRDNGPGIPQKILDKIFQPFFTTKPTGQGTGLGLSLAYDIVKAHGGELKVMTKEAEGTEFIIVLPANNQK